MDKMDLNLSIYDDIIKDYLDRAAINNARRALGKASTEVCLCGKKGSHRPDYVNCLYYCDTCFVAHEIATSIILNDSELKYMYHDIEEPVRRYVEGYASSD